MAITVADNFSYQGKKPLDGRDGFDTLAQMKAYPEASVYDGCMTYCKEDEKYYTFKASNTVDVTTGKWREFQTGGGSYSDFTGATASTAGAHGLVPAPSAGDEGKVLFGNGLWGALPSVDLSMLSNEAFQFSLTEKPVGTWTDSNNVTKLLYAKTTVGTTGAAGTDTTIGTIANVDNMVYQYGEVTNVNGIRFTAPNNYIFIKFANGNVQTYQNDVPHANQPCNITSLYTKTTDSPLPSDVKFAGVTASGEVILEKTITVSNPTVGENTISHGISNLGDLIGLTGRAKRLGDGFQFVIPTIHLPSNDYSIAFDGVTSTAIKLRIGSGFTGQYVLSDIVLTIRYTLAS